MSFDSLDSDVHAELLSCSHATHDLFNAISAGEYPEWDLQIQTMDPKDELNFDFDPLDATKVQVSHPMQTSLKNDGPACACVTHSV